MFLILPHFCFCVEIKSTGKKAAMGDNPVLKNLTTAPEDGFIFSEFSNVGHVR